MEFGIGVVKDAVAEFYDRYDIEADIEVTHRSMNWYDATATYTDKRMGRVTAHYTALLVNGKAVFQ